MPIKQLLDLTGRKAIVTGGSRGRGLQMAEALGEMGAEVLIAARKQNELDAAVDSLGISGIKGKGNSLRPQGGGRNSRARSRGARPPPATNTYAVPGVAICRARADGLIASHRDYYDLMTLMRQIGIA
jgi:NAD(P)-dependent dehydrogenase (short-subunit alcohol dehydrogenase family)